MPEQPTTIEHLQRLRVSPYQRASSWLLSLLFSVGLAVVVLLLIWWTNRAIVVHIAVPVEMTEIGDGEGGGDGRATGGSQLDTPTDEAVAGTDDPLTEVRDSLAAVSEVPVENAAKLEEQLEDPALVVPKRRDYGTGGGTWGGSGPGRGLGHGPGRPGLPRRWEVQFLKGNTLNLYARQLDFFGIELAILLPDGNVAYAFNLSKPKPDTRTGAPDAEKRYYLTWRTGAAELQEADRELLRRAGLQAGDRLILKFLPPAIEAQLVDLESKQAGSSVKNVRKTLFGIQTAGDGYSFYVLKQTYK